jgi:hypothetical protein
MLTVLVLAMLAGDSHSTSELVGHWRGESVCVKADWNAACNDEVVFYDAVPAEKSGRVLLHAYKIVNGENQPMGDLEFAYDAGLKSWAADFSNARVRIRFIFDVHGSALDGRLLDLKNDRIARHIRVSREASSR